MIGMVKVLYSNESFYGETGDYIIKSESNRIGYNHDGDVESWWFKALGYKKGTGGNLETWAILDGFETRENGMTKKYVKKSEEGSYSQILDVWEDVANL